jgi:hypothetical protein
MLVRRMTSLGVLVGSLALVASPAASAKTHHRASARASVTSVEQQAAALPAATTPALAARDQAALQPSVDAAVQQGAAAVTSLLASGNPSIASDLVHDATVTVSTTNTTDATTASTCWGSHSTQITVGAAGVNFGWRKVQENGWCGNGSTITSNNGASYTAWRGGPYCWNDVQSNWSWDGSHAWLHGRNYASLGGSYIWGCASLQTIAPVIRIEANGNWDRYNDY